MESSLVRRILTDYELVYVTFGRHFESNSQTPCYNLSPLPAASRGIRQGASAHARNRPSGYVSSEALQTVGGSSSIWLLGELVGQSFLPLGSMANESNSNGSRFKSAVPTQP